MTSWTLTRSFLATRVETERSDIFAVSLMQRDLNMADILQTTFSLTWMKSIVLWLKFRQSFLLNAQLMISQLFFIQWFGVIQRTSCCEIHIPRNRNIGIQMLIVIGYVTGYHSALCLLMVCHRREDICRHNDDQSLNSLRSDDTYKRQ